MSKAQFWILNFLGGICALLIVGAVVFSRINTRLNDTVTQTQNREQPRFNEAQQRFIPFENLAVRVGHGSQTNALLLDLMRKHGVSVALNIGGQTKQVP